MKARLVVGCLITMTMPAVAEPTDMTGMACSRPTTNGLQNWEFYDDIAIRYYEDGSVTRLPRIGLNAYEKYDRDGDWNAVFYFFKTDDGVQLRILSRPGLIVRDENPAAPLEIGVVPFNGTCVPIWGKLHRD